MPGNNWPLGALAHLRQVPNIDASWLKLNIYIYTYLFMLT